MKMIISYSPKINKTDLAWLPSKMQKWNVTKYIYSLKVLVPAWSIYTLL